MAYAVELRFDEDLAERVRALWQALEQIGAGSFGPGGAPVPHLSLAVYDDEAEVDAAAAGDLVAELAARGARSEIAFASLGVFPTAENVLFLAPVVTPALLDLHAAYHAMAQRLGRPAARTTCRGAGCPTARSRCRHPSPAYRMASASLAASWTTVSRHDPIGRADQGAAARHDRRAPPGGGVRTDLDASGG